MGARRPARRRRTAAAVRNPPAAAGPVLLPPPAPVRRPLPGWLAGVAALGLAVLVCSTLPAVLRRTRLAHDLDRLRQQVTLQEREVRRLERELEAARHDSFTYERALRSLLRPPTASSDPTGGTR